MGTIIDAPKETEQPAIPPDPEGFNDQRAEWARLAVEAFSDLTGAEMVQEAMGDLLCNLFHLCDRQGLDMESMIRSARGCYEEETRAT